jgi:LAS superfamily LD-carboxypeptidase LdcB
MKAYGYLRGRQVELDLVHVGADGNGRPCYLHRPAAEDWLRLEADARMAKVPVHKNAAWRGMMDQQILYDEYDAAKKKHDALVAAGKPSKPPSLVAKPGRSTHQSGCSVDADQHPWIHEHAPKYGFVNDAPGEGWHWTHMASVQALIKQMGLR